ncbi:hypothetical protein FA13DRAFT_242722 [Coprinellus micaceus]|uniref:Uncharacterized protein n=1 Tax=Coprinellus micaceus TaxID=71717 RepID=A0A4Y7SF85_COPMI|nr:hypothetical protein FA13DRAFT_242722 [Coprinellus micaceus]
MLFPYFASDASNVFRPPKRRKVSSEVVEEELPRDFHRFWILIDLFPPLSQRPCAAVSSPSLGQQSSLADLVLWTSTDDLARIPTTVLRTQASFLRYRSPHSRLRKVEIRYALDGKRRGSWEFDELGLGVRMPIKYTDLRFYCSTIYTPRHHLLALSCRDVCRWGLLRTNIPRSVISCSLEHVPPFTETGLLVHMTPDNQGSVAGSFHCPHCDFP